MSAAPISLGPTELGSVHQVVIEIANNTNYAVEIVGTQSSCLCVSLEKEKRFVLLGNSTKYARAEVRMLRHGDFHQRIHYYLDSPQQNYVVVDIFATVFKEKS